MNVQNHVLRLRPLEYAHVTNENDNTTLLHVGPLTRALSSNETISVSVTPYVVVPSGYFCRIGNPHARVLNAATGREEPVVDAQGQVKARLGETEVRYKVPPFPLYPEEVLLELSPLLVLPRGEALVVRVVPSAPSLSSSLALSPKGSGGKPRFKAAHSVSSADGHREQYLLRGPATYYPSVNEEVVERRRAVIVQREEGLHCKALERFVDDTGRPHVGGEEYLQTAPGAYFVHPSEVVLSVVKPIILGQDHALHVEVRESYVDPRAFSRGTVRHAGEVFMVTGDDCASFLCHPHDQICEHLERVWVSSSEYCVVLNAVGDSGRPNIGARKVLTDTNFFLKPGESLELPPHPIYLLSDNQAVLLTALEDFWDEDVTPAVQRTRGDVWLVPGPRQLIPHCHVAVVPDARSGSEIRERVLLSEGQGLYVRDQLSGEVRSVIGPTSYMLGAREEWWEKPLSPKVEKQLKDQLTSPAAYMNQMARGALHGKSEKAVVYHIPHRSVTQLYNYKTQATRIVFGPERIILEPDEEFTVISLSGSPWDPKNPTKCLPKEPNRITSLYLFLGPANMSDVVYVETRDHAQLALQLCYDWYFDIAIGDVAAANRCFSVTDFVGDACSFIASRIRAAVATLPFEVFHKNSAKCLKEAVFGLNASTGLPEEELRFPVNHLVITSVDTQEMDVLDVRTRQGLQKSVKMAIEITTQAQEADAQQVATTRGQEARGLLDRQCMHDQIANEEQRKTLLEAESGGLLIANSGRSKAIAEAISTAAEIEGNAAVTAARIRAEKEQLSYKTMTEMQRQRKMLQVSHEASMAAEESTLRKALDTVGHDLMANVVAALGPDTMAEIAKAGPSTQAKLLKSLGLEGYLVTDGSTPINLFRTAEGLTATSAAGTTPASSS